VHLEILIPHTDAFYEHQVLINTQMAVE
jgi:hypothetical protein